MVDAAVLPEPTDLGTHFRGETVVFLASLKWLDTGLPMDLTGATIWATFKDDITQNDAIPPGFQLSNLTTGVEIWGLPEDGVVRVRIADVQTASLTDTTQFQWDIKVRLPDDPFTPTGPPDSLAKIPAWGYITFVPSVTQAIS